MALLALRGLKCDHYTTTTSLHSGNKAWWIHVLILFTPNSDSTIWNVSTEIGAHQTRQHFSSLQLSNFGELLQTVTSFSYLLCRWVVPGGVFCCCRLPQGCMLWLHKYFALKERERNCSAHIWNLVSIILWTEWHWKNVLLTQRKW